MTQQAAQTASWGRRFAALAIDWVACTLVVVAVVGRDAYFEPGTAYNFWPLLVFVLESALGIALLGGSFGHLVTRIRVLRTSGRPVSLLMALVRQAMVCLVIPPLVFRPDGRGLHDMLADSVTRTLPKD